MSLLAFVIRDPTFPPLLHWVWIVPTVICLGYGSLLQRLATKLGHVLKRSHASRNDTLQADRFAHQMVSLGFQSVVMVSLVLMPTAFAMFASLNDSDMDPLAFVTLILPPVIVWVMLRALLVRTLGRARRQVAARLAESERSQAAEGAPEVLQPTNR